jgi:hypothetical protein
MRYLFSLLIVSVLANLARAGDDPVKFLKPITGADSYAFSVSDQAQAAVEVKYQKGVPLHCVADKIEFFRTDKVLVYKDKDVWQRTRTGTLSDPLRILAPSAKVRAVSLPHEELAILGKALGKLKKTDGILIGTFDEENAKKLARTEDRDLARGGTAQIWLDDKGNLSKYEIAIRVQGVRGNADVDGVMTRTVSVSGVGATKVELPAAAKKALE